MVTQFTFGIAIASLGIASIASAVECSCQCSKVNLTLERPINIVLEPEYHAEVKEHHAPRKKAISECPATQVHKLQYAPSSEDSSLLKEKESPPAEANGVKYEKTKELYVSPSPDPAIKKADIIQEKTPDPAPSAVQ